MDLIKPSRRQFLGIGAALIAAPAIVRATSLMRVRTIAPTLAAVFEATDAAYFDLQTWNTMAWSKKLYEEYMRESQIVKHLMVRSLP